VCIKNADIGLNRLNKHPAVTRRLMTHNIFSPTVPEHLYGRSTTTQKGLNCALAQVILVVIVLCLPDNTIAQEIDCVRLDNNGSSYNLDNSISYFEDNTTTKQFEEIHHSSDNQWHTVLEHVPSFGFSNSVYWLRFDICKSHPDEELTVLEIQNPLLDSIDLFAVRDDSIIYQSHSGDRIPFSERPENHRNFLFYLPKLETTPLRVYIRIQTESAIQMPLTLCTLTGFTQDSQEMLLWQGLYFGIILAMILYNAFLFFSIREVQYLYYIYFTISYFIFQAILQGFFQQYALGSVWWQNHGLLIFGFSSIAFANLFACSFLQMQKEKPILSRILRGIGFLSVLSAVLASMLPYMHMVKLMLGFSISSSLLIMFAGFTLWFSTYLPARIFTLAWLTLLVSFVLASLNKFALLPRSFWTENIMQIGGVLEVTLLSIALGVRIAAEKQQRIIAEQRLSSSLESEVRERTLSLNKALKQLEAANFILGKMSLSDSLTDLANRRAFDIQFKIDYQSASRTGAPLSLLMIDIDFFKKVNDTYGHQAGDQVLRLVATAIRSQATRPRDKVYRYGGEEFAVVLNNTKLNGAFNVAEKMRTAVERLQFTFEQSSCSVTISAGICVYVAADSGQPVAELVAIIREADRQLYLAKNNGRNRIEHSIICGMNN
jgi:diguanylate cyclase (GGDEF)-like protein